MFTGFLKQFSSWLNWFYLELLRQNAEVSVLTLSLVSSEAANLASLN